MSKDDEVKKTLGKWLGKAKAIGQPPALGDAGGMLSRPERAATLAGDDALTQLNYKIPYATKKKIKQLALRDNITLLTMLDRMVVLFEKEHCKLGTK